MAPSTLGTNLLGISVMAIDKVTASIAGLFVGVIVAWFVSRKKDTTAGENAHQEIYRLREDMNSLHYLLVLANGVLIPFPYQSDLAM
jgi:hypothetical protein